MKNYLPHSASLKTITSLKTRFIKAMQFDNKGQKLNDEVDCASASSSTGIPVVLILTVLFFRIAFS